MKTIETTIFVDEQGQLTLKVPEGIAPGHHRIVLVIDEQVSLEGAQTVEAIDADFAEMAHDEDYQAEAQQMEQEFSLAQWEAFKMAEVEE
jgi:hypothetical protein